MTHWDHEGKTYNHYSRHDLQVVRDAIIGDGVQSLIEFAAGTGYFPKMLRAAGWNHVYLGSDSSPNMVEHSKKQCPEESFILLDMNEPLPFKDRSWDGALMVSGWYAKNKVATLKEFRRIVARYIYLGLFNNFTDGLTDLRYQRGEMRSDLYNEVDFRHIIEESGMKIAHDEDTSSDFCSPMRFIKLDCCHEDH